MQDCPCFLGYLDARGQVPLEYLHTLLLIPRAPDLQAPPYLPRASVRGGRGGVGNCCCCGMIAREEGGAEGVGMEAERREGGRGGEDSAGGAGGDGASSG